MAKKKLSLDLKMASPMTRNRGLTHLSLRSPYQKSSSLIFKQRSSKSVPKVRTTSVSSEKLFTSLRRISLGEDPLPQAQMLKRHSFGAQIKKQLSERKIDIVKKENVTFARIVKGLRKKTNIFQKIFDPEPPTKKIWSQSFT